MKSNIMRLMSCHLRVFTNTLEPNQPPNTLGPIFVVDVTEVSFLFSTSLRALFSKPQKFAFDSHKVKIVATIKFQYPWKQHNHQ